MHDGAIVFKTKLDNSGLDRGIKVAKGSLGGLVNVAKSLGAAIGVAFSVNAIANFVKESVKASNELSSALTGLQSILDGQGRSFNEAKKFLEEYTADGLVPMTNAVAAYKNLAARGYDDAQIQKTMISLKDAAAFGRQSSYTMGQAIQSATEGLKNENSVLVDNAGVTKNVAKMWEEYAASIGTTANNLTKEQKIQAEVNGILEESKYQAGDAAKIAGTLSGQLSQLSVNFNNLKVAVGEAVKPILQAFLPAINTAVTTMTQIARTAATAMSLLFGSVSSSTAEVVTKVADGYKVAASNAEELKEATEEVGKAAKRHLAGFDEITKMDSASSVASSATGTSSSTSATVTASADSQDKISPKMQALVDKILAMLEPLKTGIKGLQPMGEWLWREFLQPMATWTGGVVSDAINELADALIRISGWIQENYSVVNNFAILLASIAGSFGAISIAAQIVEYIGAVAALAPEVGLLAAMFPKLSAAVATVSTWITGTLVPAVTTALSGIAAALGISVGWVVAIVAAIGVAVAAIIIYWDEIVAAVQNAWKKIQEVWSVVADWFEQSVVRPVFAFFSELWEGVKTLAADAWEKVKEFFAPGVKWFSNLFGSVERTVSDAFYNIGMLASGCWQVIKVVWAEFSGWFNKDVIQPVTGFFTNMWNGLKNGAINAWNGIKAAFAPVATWFKTIFSNAWKGVVSVFSTTGAIFTNIKDGILAAFKKIVNGLITGLNNVIATPFNGINTALKAIKNINILGLTPFAGLKVISVPKIPYLAQGAVLPANKPFLAMVGDQKHGTNVEAPLETIQEAVAVVMADMLGGMMAGFEAVVANQKETHELIREIEIGDDVIGRAAARYSSSHRIIVGGASPY